MGDFKMPPSSNEATTIKPDSIPFIPKNGPSESLLDNNESIAIVGWNASFVSAPPPSYTMPQPYLPSVPYPPSQPYPPSSLLPYPPLSANMATKNIATNSLPELQAVQQLYLNAFQNRLIANSEFYFRLSIAIICFTTLMMFLSML